MSENRGALFCPASLSVCFELRIERLIRLREDRFVSTKDLKNAVFNAQYQFDVTQVAPR